MNKWEQFKLEYERKQSNTAKSEKEKKQKEEKENAAKTSAVEDADDDFMADLGL